MAIRWGGFDLKQIGDPALRSQLKKLDVWLKQRDADLTAVGITTVTFVATGSGGGLVNHATRHLPSGVDPLTIAAPVAVGTANSAGTADSFVRSDHVHDASALLPLDGTRDMTGELGSDVGTFRSDVASGGTGFTFNTSNSFTSGDIFRFNDNTSGMLAQSFEGHISTIRSESATLTADLLHVRRALVGDNRLTFRGINIQPSVTGTIAGASYGPTLTGVNCAMTFNPTSMAAIGSKTVNGGIFAAAINGAATATVATVRGGLFNVTDSGASMPVTNAYAGHFQFSGSFAGGVTNSYGARVDSIGVGTNRWAFWGSNKIHCDASDFIAAASAKGYVNKDSQSASAGGGGTARYWRMFVDASATGAAGDVTLNVDSLGVVTATRAGGATGTIQLKLVDVGTAAPLT